MALVFLAVILVVGFLVVAFFVFDFLGFLSVDMQDSFRTDLNGLNRFDSR
jgi:hypothetical protein